MAQTMASSSCIVTQAPSLFKPSSLRLSSVSSEFSGDKLRLLSLATSSRPKRSVVTMVRNSEEWEKPPPPDLASYLFSNRIVYLGMPIVLPVADLLIAEFLYLQFEDDENPISLYINSTGTTKDGGKLSCDKEALSVYDTMSYIKPPIYTLCVGNAMGEAALLLAAGEKGNRAALPSSTIMIKQPAAQFQGQATDVELARKEVTRIKSQIVTLLSTHTGKSLEEIEADIRRPKYFSPSEAIEYGIIDKVIHNEGIPMDRGVVADLKKAQVI